MKSQYFLWIAEGSGIAAGRIRLEHSVEAIRQGSQLGDAENLHFEGGDFTAQGGAPPVMFVSL